MNECDDGTFGEWRWHRESRGHWNRLRDDLALYSGIPELHWFTKVLQGEKTGVSRPNYMVSLVERGVVWGMSLNCEYDAEG